MLRTIQPAIIATLLATLQFAAWAAIGSFFIPASVAWELAAPGAVLVGVALGGGALAVAAGAGMVQLGLAFWWGTSLVALLVCRRRLWSWAAGLAAEWRQAFAGRRWMWVVAAVMVLACWGLAVAPPRDADVMRYHLAHLRQILADGRWVAIADYHYALPFGWSMAMLGFEWLRYPEAVQIVNLLLWLLLCGAIIACAASRRLSAPVFLLLTVAALQPYVLKALTAAFADSYAILVVGYTTVLLWRLERAGPAEWTLLGFAAWTGMQSRYQLIAAGLAATAVALLYAFRQRRWRLSLYFAAGSTAAWLLALPYYGMNLRAFGDPFWPLMIGRFTNGRTYADRVVAAYDQSLQGHLTVAQLGRALGHLLTDPFAFPVPILIGCALGVAVLSRERPVRRAGGFTAIFFLLWAAAQPSLYPRFSILLVGPALAILVRMLSQVQGRRLLTGVTVPLAVAAAGMGAYATWYSVDAARYLVSGDLAAYHRYTWYWQVYRWANRATQPGARFLVIVTSGLSYYLNRPYRRADPWLTGEVDWTEVRDGRDLMSILKAGGYQYVIYEDRDWSGFLGGSDMMGAVRDATARGSLAVVCRFDVDLATSRVRRTFVRSKVLVLGTGPEARAHALGGVAANGGACPATTASGWEPVRLSQTRSVSWQH